MKKGFTLIELLVVVLIIGILAAVALPQYFRVVEKSRSAEALSVLSNIVDAQKRHYLTHEAYAVKFSDLDLEFNDRNGIEIGEQNSLETPSFVYTLNGTEGDKAGVIATRKNGSKYEYKIARSYETGVLACDNEEICRSLLSDYRINIGDVVETGEGEETEDCPPGYIAESCWENIEGERGCNCVPETEPGGIYPLGGGDNSGSVNILN